MPKSIAPGTVRPRAGRVRPADLPNAVEGRIAEICRDIAVQAKRMRQLHEQADELRTAIRQWAAGFDADLPSRPSSRGRRR
jgi:hypothetical protein